MNDQNFTTTMVVGQTPKQAFDAINNVRGWWSEAVEESTDKLNDEFIYRHKPVHYSKHRIIELIPNKKVVWLITDSQLTFVDHQTEWTGTTVSFDIAEKDGQTEIVFTHHGLVPQCQCYNGCSGGWNHYLLKSLQALITTGKGNPDKKETV